MPENLMAQIGLQDFLSLQPGYDEVNAALAEDPAKRKKLKGLRICDAYFLHFY